ncbi:MAG: shikimate kinase [Candidatus Gracilibacteria bacterium]|jgi:shikimate kinase
MSNLQIISTHIILVGFKNVGKSSIGLALSSRLDRKFVDLDDQIIAEHWLATGEKLSCRELMKSKGEDFFRKIEHQVLKKVLDQSEPFVLALGGGTPLLAENRELLKNHLIVHVSAPKSIVFERIMINGKPAFFPQQKQSFDTFQELWSEREPVFEQISDIKVCNTGSIEEAVEKINLALASSKKKSN